MSGRAGRRTFRTPRSVYAAIAAAELLFLIGAVTMYRATGWSVTTLVLVGLNALGLGGLIESSIQRVVLEDDAIIVTKLWSQRRYERSMIASVHQAKGTPTTLKLNDGSRIRLPDVGHVLGNSIRAWVRAPTRDLPSDVPS